MKAFRIALTGLLLTALLSSCLLHRRSGGRRYRNVHVPASPPGYRGM